MSFAEYVLYFTKDGILKNVLFVVPIVGYSYS